MMLVPVTVSIKTHNPSRKPWSVELTAEACRAKTPRNGHVGFAVRARAIVDLSFTRNIDDILHYNHRALLEAVVAGMAKELEERFSKLGGTAVVG
jgi:hypothetical protein